MGLVLLVALLSHDEFAAREHAERALRGREYETLVVLTNQSECPEAKPRLERAKHRAMLRKVDTLLPDSRPFWPDRDYLRPHISPSYSGQLDGVPVGYSASMSLAGQTYVPYRIKAKAFIIWYVRTTQDWEGARTMLAQAALGESLSGVKTQATGSVWYTLLFCEPTLLKGYHK